MARGSPLLSLAAGLGTGYLNTKKQIAEQARIDEDRAMQREERQLRLDDARQLRDQNAAVATAGKPIGVQEVAGADLAPGEMGPSPTAPTLGGFKVGGSSFLDRGQADTAAAAENTPEAQTSRIAAAYRANGAPDKALTLENAAFTQKIAKEKYTQDQKDRASKYKQEGLIDAAKALRAGDAAGVFQAFNAGGEYKLDGEPEITREDREVPGIGKIPTYNAKVRVLGPDGKVQERVINSHDLSMSLMPFEKTLDFLGKSAKDASDSNYKAGMLGATQKNADASMIRAQRTGGGDGGGTKAPSGYRFAGDGKTLEAIPGGPADKPPSPGKPLPISAANGVLTNQQNLRRAQKALALVSGETVEGAAGDTNATGKKGWLPNQILNRMDPEGVDTRAAIADLGSLVIHDRSGAAVTASEFPRLAPFIPTEKDDAATVKKKLTMFTKNYQAVVDDATEFYRESGYNVPIDKLKSGNSDAAKTPTALPTSKSALQPGMIYQTSRGPAKWNGTAFEAQ